MQQITRSMQLTEFDQARNFETTAQVLLSPLPAGASLILQLDPAPDEPPNACQVGQQGSCALLLHSRSVDARVGIHEVRFCRIEFMAPNGQIEKQLDTARNAQFLECPEEIILHGMLA